MINRRDFLIKSAILSSTGLFAKTSLPSELLFSMKPQEVLDISPLRELKNFKGTTEILGDTPDEAHEIFWNKEGFIKRKGGLPAASKTYDVVIVGGGLAGLSSAYHLQDYKVLMLEGHPQLGGNARVEKYKDTYMSLGSAYVTIPEKDGFIEHYFKDIGVADRFKVIPHKEHPIIFKGEFVKDFWSGQTDPSNKEDFKNVYSRLMSIKKNEYPELPLIPGSEINRSKLNALDKLTLKEWVKKEFGEIHPHIQEYFHQYCWSSFSSAYDEISAAQFLNFFTADLAGTQALPGGNGMIASATYNKLRQNKNFTAQGKSFVADVRENDKGVSISYYEQGVGLKTVQAKSCIFTAPKIVAKKIIENIPKEQEKAMEEMNYHAYLVMNVLFKNKLEAKHYDVYSIIGEVPTNEYEDSKERVFSDITYAHWANEKEAQKSAVTLYLPLPYAMAHQYLFSPALYSKYSKRVQAALEPFLTKSGKSWDDIEGLRLTRYGHSVAVANAGAIASGQLERAHQPIRNKIFFANQDNWANPCFETSYVVGAVAAYQATGRKLPV